MPDDDAPPSPAAVVGQLTATADLTVTPAGDQDGDQDDDDG